MNWHITELYWQICIDFYTDILTSFARSTAMCCYNRIIMLLLQCYAMPFLFCLSIEYNMVLSIRLKYLLWENFLFIMEKVETPGSLRIKLSEELKPICKQSSRQNGALVSIMSMRYRL